MSHAKRVAVAERAARAGARVALDAFRSDLAVETKGSKTNLVTDADRRAQRCIVDVIEGAYPGETILGEESGLPSSLPADGIAWIIDPIDGTGNYVHGNAQWTTAVTVVRDTLPIASVNIMPVMGDVFVASPDGFLLNGEPATVSDRVDPKAFTVAPMMGWGCDHEGVATLCGLIADRFGVLQRFHTGQTTLSMVASGQLEGALTISDGSPWDRIGGVHMVEAAGGEVTDARGDAWEPDASGLVVSNGTAHDELLAVVSDLSDSIR